MGLKITKEIETSKGITSEAYIRISGYSVTKYSGVCLVLEVFRSKSDVDGLEKAIEINAVTAKNNEIGLNIFIPSLDIPSLESQSIFAYGYGKLKEKLSALYGAENIIDC